MRLNRILQFIALSYGLCWAIAFSYFLNGGSVGSGWFGLIAVLCMFTPAAAAAIIHKGIDKRPLSEIGLVFTFNRWYIYAALVAVLLPLLSIPMSLPLPGIELSNGLDFINRQLSQGEMPAAEAEQAVAMLESMGGWLPVVIIGGGIVAALIFGPTINAIPALGEELGWRGFLQEELKPLGFWRSSGLIGVIWGLWHAPMIIYGYNYPGYPVAGVFMMTIFTVLLSPPLAWLREKSGSVLGPAIFHGTLNAIAALPFIFLAGGNRLLTGMTGVGGMVVLVLVNIYIWRFRRN